VIDHVDYVANRIGIDHVGFGSDFDGATVPSEVGDVTDVAGTAPAGNIDKLAADIAAGRLTPQQAVDRLVDEIAGTEQLAETERAELREMMTDLIANDPNLAALVGRI